MTGPEVLPVGPCSVVPCPGCGCSLSNCQGGCGCACWCCPAGASAHVHRAPSCSAPAGGEAVRRV